MENDSNITNNCRERDTTSILQGAMGSVGAVMCIIALIIVLASRFYKDTVQRLIVYKLIAMLVFSLSQLLFLGQESNMYGSLLSNIAYNVNLLLTFWLTIILYLCIVHLKELRKLRKLEPVAIIISCLPFIFVTFIPFAKYDECKEKPIVVFSEGESNELEYIYITGYCIAGLLQLIISILVIIIFVKVVTRSRLPLQGLDNNQAETPLLTNNKWKTLSKQLLPLVVYPIINTILAVIFFPLATLSYDKIKYNSPLSALAYALLASLGLFTSAIVILHLCILKCKKRQGGWKRREGRYSQLEHAGAVNDTPNERSDIFTSDTIASTNARTEYHYDRNSTIY